MNRRDFGWGLMAATSARALGASDGSAADAAGGLHDVPGLKVGHFTHPRQPTACTAM